MANCGLPFPTFAGGDTTSTEHRNEARNFIRAYELYCKANSLDKELVFGLALRDETREWLSAHRHGAIDRSRSWDKTKAAFLADYAPQLSPRKAVMLMLSCKEMPNEHVRMFMVRCLAVAMETSPTPEPITITTMVTPKDDPNQTPFEAKVTLTEDQMKTIDIPYVKTSAMMIFFRGVEPAIANRILSDPCSYTLKNWDQLKAFVYRTFF